MYVNLWRFISCFSKNIVKNNRDTGTLKMCVISSESWKFQKLSLTQESAYHIAEFNKFSSVLIHKIKTRSSFSASFVTFFIQNTCSKERHDFLWICRHLHKKIHMFLVFVYILFFGGNSKDLFKWNMKFFIIIIILSIIPKNSVGRRTEILTEFFISAEISVELFHIFKFYEPRPKILISESKRHNFQFLVFQC